MNSAIRSAGSSIAISAMFAVTSAHAAANTPGGDAAIDAVVEREWHRTRSTLDALPGRKRIDARLSELIDGLASETSPSVDTQSSDPPALLAPASATAGTPDRVAILTDGRVAAAWPDVAGHALYIHDARGEPTQAVPLPGIGSLSRLSATDRVIHFEYGSFTQPPGAYVYEPGNERLRVVRSSVVRFDTDRYLIERLDVHSRDGFVPVIVVRRRQPAASTPGPMFVYVNAARGSRVPSGFSAPVANWLEMGGSFAFVHARGSGALGAAWRRAGQGEGKLASVDDVLAAVAELVRRGLARRDRIVMHATGHSSLVLLAALARDPSIARAMWLSHAVADPLSLPESPTLVEEYGAGAAGRAVVRAMFELDSSAARKLPPTLLTTSLDQPPALVAQSYRLFQVLAARDPENVLLRATSMPQDPAELARALKDERVDVYTFLGSAVGALR